MASDKSGSPPCGIYLHIKDVQDKIKVLTDLRQVAMVVNRTSGYAQNMNMVMFDYDPLQVIALRELVEAMRMGGFVAISGGGLTGFESTAADGVLLQSVEEIAGVRAQVGEQAIIGLDARDVNLSLKELVLTGADFVVLPADQGKISTWVMLSDKPCVVKGKIDNDNCGDFAAAGASFVDVTHYIMSHKKGAMQGAVNILHALELAAGQRPVKN